MCGRAEAVAEATIVVRGSETFLRNLERIIARFPQASGTALYAAGEAIRAYMVDNYLSGQRLRRVTGKLASGFSTVLLSPAKAVVGTRTRYAAVHEFGFDGDVTVRAHQRNIGDRIVSVRSHTRHMRVREKRYARDALRYGSKTALAAADNAVERSLRAS